MVRVRVESLKVGAMSGAIVSGFMKIREPAPTNTSNKQIIAQQALAANASVTLLNSTAFKFAIILLHGDGDASVTNTIQGATTRSLTGAEQAIEPIANETITITASASAAGGNTPTIEILSLS